MEVVLGLISLVILLIWLVSPSRRLRELGNKIPGPKAIPIFGNALSFHVIGPKANADLFAALKEFGPVFRIWIGPQLHVFLSSTEDIQFLLSSQSLITKAHVYETLHSWLGTGLLASTGSLWHRRRKAITPTFHFKVLDDFVPVFNKCAGTLVKCLKEKASSAPFDILPFLSNCALDAITESAMGTQIEAQTKPNSEYVVSVSEMTRLLGRKINYPWLGCEPLYTLSGQKSEESFRLGILHSQSEKVLREKKATLGNGDDSKLGTDDMGIKKRCAFLEMLLKIKNADEDIAFKTDQDILDEVVTFMFEGHDTTTLTLSFTVWLLGKHQDIQEKVYKEVSSILSSADELKIEHLQEMKYLERVLKESLRLYPPVPYIGRYFESDITLPSGFVVPGGTDVYASIMLIHRDPELFPEPDRFDPDRFLDEQKHPYAYIPFSAGPRNCIGQKFAMLNLKAILSQVIYNYTITTDKEEELDQDLMLRFVGELDVSLEKRIN